MLASLTGCGDHGSRCVPVAGRVLIDGEPLTYGQVRFIPATGRASYAKLDQNGRFTLSCFDQDDGAILGNHQIAVYANEQISPSKMLWHAPKKYANPTTSHLVQTIDQPTTSVVVNLTWEGGKAFVEIDEVAEKSPYDSRGRLNSP
jgi:hypothetical protein